MTEHDPAIHTGDHTFAYHITRCGACLRAWEARRATDPLFVEEPVRPAPWNRAQADRFWLLVAFCALCFVAGLVFGRAA